MTKKKSLCYLSHDHYYCTMVNSLLLFIKHVKPNRMLEDTCSIQKPQQVPAGRAGQNSHNTTRKSCNRGKFIEWCRNGSFKKPPPTKPPLLLTIHSWDCHLIHLQFLIFQYLYKISKAFREGPVATPLQRERQHLRRCQEMVPSIPHSSITSAKARQIMH